MLLKERWFKTCNLHKTIHPSIHSLPLCTDEEVLHRFHLDFFDLVTALSKRAMLWNVFLLYSKEQLYMYINVAILNK